VNSVDSGSPGILARAVAQLRLAGAARAVILLVGAGTLAYGLLNAWRAVNVSTLVVVGAVMLVAALVFPHDWSQLRLAWGDASALISRVQDELEEVATSSSTEAELREQIDQLRTDLAAVAKQPLRPRRTAEELLGVGRPRAYHTFRGRDSVALTVTTVPLVRNQPTKLSCDVTRPSGDVDSAATRDPEGLAAVAGLSASRFSLVYPDDFPGSQPLASGEYEVSWRSARPPGTTMESALAAAASRPYATDRFVIPE
jgi:hypothetical protein